MDDAALAACFEQCRVRSLGLGEYFLRAGEPATDTGLLLSGLLREYFTLEDGTERSKAFIVQGRPTGSMADLLSANVSRASIVAEEPSRVLVIPFQFLQALWTQSPAWKEYYARILERLFLQKAEREYELLGLRADARYQLFQERYPGLSARLKARHVASYLGITPVHLSRLRRRGRKAKAPAQRK